MNKFDAAFHDVIIIEGGYSDHKYDSGGKTKFGITESLARAYNYEGEMKDLSKEMAKHIYYKEFWTRNNYDLIEDYDIALEVFEQSINLVPSPRKANKNLQRSYNYVMQENILTIDGLVGPITIDKINTCPYQSRLFKFLNLLQAKHYLDITEANPNNLHFINGWIEKRIILRK